MKKLLQHWTTLLLLLIATSLPATAQTTAPAAANPQASYQRYTYAPGSPTWYRYMHGEQGPGQGVFLADPNVWVYTTEFARRAGMPLEWASDELKGVTAAAFRMQTLGAEMECGWGGNPRACKPAVQCVLEFYFDRQQHPLPWRADALPVDINLMSSGHSDSSTTHFMSMTLRRRDGLSASGQPFANPATGEKLYWNGVPVLAYDREFDGQFSFVRILLGCQGATGHIPTDGRLFRLETKSTTIARQEKKSYSSQPPQIFAEVFLPASWNARVHQLRQQNFNNDHQFYQNIWNNSIKQGAQK